MYNSKEKVKSIWSLSQFIRIFSITVQVETHVYYNETTRFPSCYNEKVSDASELTPRNQKIIQKSPRTYRTLPTHFLPTKQQAHETL